MPKNSIYVVDHDKYDFSRWLTVEDGNFEGTVAFVLTDLCRPGNVSSMERIELPIEFVGSSLRNGALQVTGSRGFVNFRRAGELINVEFCGSEDLLVSKASLRADDLQDQFNDLAARSQASLA